MTDLFSHPTAAEILEAVVEQLRVTPADTSQYSARVAARAIEIAARELRVDPAETSAHHERLARLGYADDSELATALREGRVDTSVLPDVRAALLADATARVQVASPEWLSGYEPD